MLDRRLPAWMLILMFGWTHTVAAEWSVTPYADVERRELRDDSPFAPVFDEANIYEETQVAGTELFFSRDEWTLRLNGRVANNDPNNSNTYRMRVREGFWEHYWPSGLNLTVGRRIQRWGTGYIARPTGLLAAEVLRDDPEDRRQRLLGSDMALLEWFRGDGTFSLAWVGPDRNAPPKEARERPRGVVRYETLVGDTDVALVAGASRPAFGFALSHVLGEALELHADALWLQGTTRRVHRFVIEGGPPSLFRSNPYERPRENSERLFLYSVVGGQLTVGPANIIFEWLHDGRGLNRSEFRAWRDLVDFHRDVLDSQPALGAAARGNLLFDLETLRPGGTMQDYLFLRVARNTGQWQPELSMFYNTHDSSFVMQPGLRYLRGNIDLQVKGNVASGSDSTEFGTIPEKASIFLHLRYRFPSG